MTFLLVMLHTGTMFAVLAYFWNAWRERYFSSVAALQRILVLVVTATGLTGVAGLALQHLIKKVYLGNQDIEQLFSNLPLMAASLAAAGILIIVAGRRAERSGADQELGWRSACWIGAVQGLCLPFRGFSRSGATISTGLLALKFLSRLLETGRWTYFGYYCLVPPQASSDWPTPAAEGVMSAGGQPDISARDKALQRRFRLIGVCILVAGLLAAAVVNQRAAPDDGDPYLILSGNAKRYNYEMERIGGKSNILAAEFQDWFGSLWHGKKLAHTLVFLSIGSSLACFFIAYVLSRPPPPDDPAAGADL